MSAWLPSFSKNSLAAGVAALAVGALATAPLAAESAAIAPNGARAADRSAYIPAAELSQFRPSDDREDHTIDYSYLDEALRWFVVPMGPSIRQGAGRVDQRLGTRRIYGHESRFRLEGNRVAFSFFTDDIRASLTEYRKDLERVGSSLELTRLPRNEQLAFWLNLHNVAVIEAIAAEYPLSQPDRHAFGESEAGLQDAKLVTVSGVKLSPRDIRERIVYPNWRNPKVIYGFWRGDIGGPSIQRLAYSADNVDQLLSLSAEEFVNSLRGVENIGKTLKVSQIYHEAETFYFEDGAQLKEHLAAYAREDTQKILGMTKSISYKRYERDIADLTRGEKDPSMDFLFTQDIQGFSANVPVRTRPGIAIQRLVEERGEKLERAWRRGIRTGQVLIDGEDGVAKEVE